MWQDQVVDYLCSQNNEPSGNDDALVAWHGYGDVVDFLRNSRSEEVPIYLSGNGTFLYGLFVPSSAVASGTPKRFLKWSFLIPSGYGWSSYSKGGEIIHTIFPPMDGVQPSLLRKSVAPIWLRWSDGVRDRYLDINQIISHVLGVHWVDQKRGWCVLDRLGDLVSVVRIYEKDGWTCCTMRAEFIERFMFLSRTYLLRFFDFHRPGSWADAVDDRRREDHLIWMKADGIYANVTHMPSKGAVRQYSYLRGYDMVAPTLNPQRVIDLLEGKADRKYVSFLIHDFKNRRLVEWSCDPNNIGNYFVKSDLPFQTSPAYFRPEVLSQYRQNPSKCQIGEREIECRGAWGMRYAVNEANQVIAYIADLSGLPHEEQLRWKSFNEPPRKGLPKSVIKTDFEASWDLDYDSLRSLKEILDSFPKTTIAGHACEIWRMPKLSRASDVDALGYVLTDSTKEWEDQILILAKIIVEGLNSARINKLAVARNCRDEKLASIKQLKVLLVSSGLEAEKVERIISPFADVQEFRTKLVAHSGQGRYPHDRVSHFRDLLQRTDVAMRDLGKVVGEGVFLGVVPPE